MTPPSSRPANSAERGAHRVSALGARRSALAHAALAALMAGAAGAQEVTLKAKASVGEVTVGQRFVVAVEASGPPGTAWTFPDQPGDEKVAMRPAPGTPTGGATFAYEAAVFAVDEVAVPAITVRYRLPDGGEGEAASEPIPLRVASLLPKDEGERGLADIRGPVKLPLGVVFWGGLAGAVAALALGVVLWRRRRRPSAATAPAAPDVEPDVEALAALDGLASSELIAASDLKPFYVALIEIAKRYLERRLGAPVLEMTTQEAVSFLRDGVPARELASPLRDLMNAADQVKFARGHSERAFAERHLAAVRAMVATLEARLRPQPAPPLEKSA